QPELRRPALTARALFRFALTELDAANLAGNRLRQDREFQTAHPLVRSEIRSAELENASRGRRVLLNTRLENHECLRDRQAECIRTWDDRRLGHGLVLEQRTFDFERTDSIIAALEYIVSASDEMHVSVAIASCFVPRPVES